MTVASSEFWQALGVSISFITSAAALGVSWKAYRSQHLETTITLQQLRASVMPIPLIQDSRLTWRGSSLLFISLKLLNVGPGPMLSVRFGFASLGRHDHELQPDSTRQPTVLMPKGEMEYRLRFQDALEMPTRDAELTITVEYQDALGIPYTRDLRMKISRGSGAGIYLPSPVIGKDASVSLQ